MIKCQVSDNTLKQWVLSFNIMDDSEFLLHLESYSHPPPLRNDISISGKNEYLLCQPDLLG